MKGHNYETNLYPEEPIHLKIFNYDKENLQDRISSLIDKGYKLSKSYAENRYLPTEELEERIDTTKKEIEIISSMLTPRETFQPVSEQLTEKRWRNITAPTQLENNQKYQDLDLSKVTVETNLGFEPTYRSFDEIKSLLSPSNEDINIVVTAENDSGVRELNESQIKTALEDLGEDYMLISLPSEEYGFEIIDEKESETNIDLLITDNKMKEDNGGLKLAEHLYSKTNHTALHTTSFTLPNHLRYVHEIEENYEFIDSAHIKTGENNLIRQEDYKELIEKAAYQNHSPQTTW